MFLESLRPSDIVAFERGWKNNDATFKQRQVRSANEAVQQQWRNSRDSEERERLASKLQKMMEEEDRFWETYLGYVSWSWRMRAGDPIANVVFFPFPPWPGHRVNAPRTFYQYKANISRIHRSTEGQSLIHLSNMPALFQTQKFIQ